MTPTEERAVLERAAKVCEGAIERSSPRYLIGKAFADAVRSLPLESKESEAEPVAWIAENGVGNVYLRKTEPKDGFNVRPLYIHPVECPKCAELENVLEQNHIKHDSTTRALEAAEAETLRIKELHKGLLKEADDRYAALLEKYNFERLK